MTVVAGSGATRDDCVAASVLICHMLVFGSQIDQSLKRLLAFWSSERRIWEFAAEQAKISDGQILPPAFLPQTAATTTVELQTSTMRRTTATY